MFEPSKSPRIFGEPPGIDFAQSLADGLTARSAGMRPEQLARVQVFVNSARMQRRLRDVFSAGPARLLPRIRLITDLANDVALPDIKPAVAPLRRRLELSQFVAKLLDQEPDLAPRSALFDLSDSLAKLMDEMQGEGVTPETIAALDVADQSGHWDRALKFLKITSRYFTADTNEPDKEARQRAVISALRADWEITPPPHPVIVAGSTGSRGATALFMQAVAKLPQGAIILPGFDHDQPSDVWDALEQGSPQQDHPQYRFKRLMDLIGFDQHEVKRWSAAKPVDAPRNRLISLSLRPAPVTNQWREEGPSLGDLVAATEGISLIEAPSPRIEAEAIALRLRQAVEMGERAALISPDRMLTRQVAAALDRWNIIPDDSAGTPLPQSPPGRFLRHVAALRGEVLTAETLLTILKHPLCHADRDDRGAHLRFTRELELHLRRFGPPFPTAATLMAWAGDDPKAQAWARWIGEMLTDVADRHAQPLADHVASHIQLAERLSAGPGAEGEGGLWQEKAGREARRVCDNLRQHADAGGRMSPHDYAALFGAILAEAVVRDRDAGHPDVLIWGTLEARVQGVDLTILGSLNEGVWPETPSPDPWLNRKMRADAGLLLPERQIGLSAHDYQQAVAGKSVWLSRAKRSADAETVPSRWVNRLTNLLGGLPATGGPEALAAMRGRGNHWVAMAERMSKPDASTPSAKRPSPQPPVSARPSTLPVTQVKTLIRDPFSVYASRVLRLRPLDPLVRSADAPLRGVILHKVLERFIRQGGGPTNHDLLLQMTDEELAKNCPWPTMRAFWRARTARSADAFLLAEGKRQTIASDQRLERTGQLPIAGVNMTITCKADRIDVTNDGQALIYDYKTGQVPSVKQQLHFDKQLLIEAVMVERGCFDGLDAMPVKDARFLAFNTEMKDQSAPLAESPPDKVWDELQKLFQRWSDPSRGYTARLALFTTKDISDYDHLSRFGEWDTSDIAVPEPLT